MESLARKTTEKDKMALELQDYKENDPEVIESIKEETVTAHEAANRWTGTAGLFYMRQRQHWLAYTNIAVLHTIVLASHILEILFFKYR